MQQLEDPTFDYCDLPLDVRAEVRDHARAIHKLADRSCRSIAEIGKRLAIVKAIVGCGLNWLARLATEFPE